jgi:hypothetical protein
MMEMMFQLKQLQLAMFLTLAQMEEYINGLELALEIMKLYCL